MRLRTWISMHYQSCCTPRRGSYQQCLGIMVFFAQFAWQIVLRNWPIFSEMYAFWKLHSRFMRQTDEEEQRFLLIQQTLLGISQAILFKQVVNEPVDLPPDQGPEQKAAAPISPNPWPGWLGCLGLLLIVLDTGWSLLSVTGFFTRLRSRLHPMHVGYPSITCTSTLCKALVMVVQSM